LSAEQAVLSVTLNVGANTQARLAAGGLAAARMAVTGLPALSTEQAVLSVTLMC